MPPLPKGAISNAGPGLRGDAVNVLLLDTLNTEQADQAYVRAQINEFLQKLEPGTQVAIFVLGSRLRFVQGFTSDTAELIAALNDKKRGMIRDPMVQTRSDNADDAGHIANLEAMRASGLDALRRAMESVTAYSRGERAVMTYEALDHIAHYLEGVPGRKNLIWFAGSIPLYFFPTPDQGVALEKNPGLPGYIEQVKKTTDLFTLSKIAVYPIGAQGVTPDHVMEASAAAPGAAGNVGHAGSTADSIMLPYIAEAGERADSMHAMEQIAAMTGGKTYFNTNNLNDAMKRAVNDGAHYYTLGYTPANPEMDGRFRRIGISVTSGKYSLAHRAGYYADSRAGSQSGPSTDPLSELLAYGLPSATGILYGVRVAREPGASVEDDSRAGENAALEGPLIRYDVHFTIRASDVGFEEGPGKKRGRILLGVKAYDRDGNPVNWLGEFLDIELTGSDFDEAQRTGLQAHLQIDLPERAGLQLVTAVYDGKNRHDGTLTVPVN
jgi:VWFA-related protein